MSDFDILNRPPNWGRPYAKLQCVVPVCVCVWCLCVLCGNKIAIRYLLGQMTVSECQRLVAEKRKWRKRKMEGDWKERILSVGGKKKEERKPVGCNTALNLLVLTQVGGSDKPAPSSTSCYDHDLQYTDIPIRLSASHLWDDFICCCSFFSGTVCRSNLL